MSSDDGVPKSRVRVKRSDVVLPELSYRIVGCLFEASNGLGPGHLERVYQRAVAKALKDAGLKFREQVRIPLVFKGEKMGWYQLDFLVEDEVILELKQGDRFLTSAIRQLLAYMKSAQKPLAILATFRIDGVLVKRLINKDLL